MNQINEDLLKHIGEFLYGAKKKCIIEMNNINRNQYINLRLLNKTFKNVIDKKCNVFFIYKPYNKCLPILCECNKHCNKTENKINIINKLNYLKISNNKHKLLNELQFQNIKECNISLPYIKEMVKVAYISENKKSIYLLNKRHRYNGFV